MADLAIQVEALERWRDGNGKPGAAAILADHEKRIAREEKRIDGISDEVATIKTGCAVERERERRMIVEAVDEAMKKRSRSIEGLVRAFGPYAAALASVAVAIIATKG